MESNSTNQVPTLNLAGFCDGSVRPAEERHEESFFDLNFRDATFYSDLQPVQPNNAGNTGWFGPVSLTDQKGNSLTGILIGLLVPAVQQGPRLQGLVIAQDGTGLFAGAPGTGRATINWGDRFSGRFDASIKLKPFDIDRR